MKKIVIANWKMNPDKFPKAQKLVADMEKVIKRSPVEVVVCPPFPFMSLLSKSKKLAMGAQNISQEKTGSFTGEVSASMIKSIGASYVIIGHSERRAMGESSDLVSKKVVTAIESKLSPIICIGEKIRDQSAEHWQEIKWQLVDSLQGVTKATVKKCIIAYEPLWAISKKAHSNPMKTEDVSESTIYIKKILAEMFGSAVANKVRIVYGGSVNPVCSKEIASAGVVSGFLVGHAGLSAKEFGYIVDSMI